MGQYKSKDQDFQSYAYAVFRLVCKFEHRGFKKAKETVQVWNKDFEKDYTKEQLRENMGQSKSKERDFKQGFKEHFRRKILKNSKGVRP
jgi:uncharacterized protein YeaO (DUF488 family)